MCISGSIAGEADGTQIEFVETDDSVYAFDNDEAVFVERFLQGWFVEARAPSTTA